MSTTLFRLANRSAGFAYVCGHIIQMVQTRLIESGVALSKADGIYGSDTQAALLAWQAESGLPATGNLSEDDWLQLIGTEPPHLFDRCLQVTATFEGHGFRKAAGNFDGAGLTWGIIGFTLKHGEIQKIIARLDATDRSIVDDAFGELADELRDALSHSTSRQLKWADGISAGAKKYGLEPAWRDSFGRLGGHPTAQELQVRRAREKYWERAESDSNALGFASDMGKALCFDIAVQNGGVSKNEAVLFHERLHSHGAAAEDDRIRRKVLAETIANTSLSKWRQDVLSRKLTLATGTGSVHGQKFFILDWGLSDDLTEESASPSLTIDSRVNNFSEFFGSIGARHFRADEFLFLGDSNRDTGSSAFGLNHIPPQELWSNIAATARVLDELRERLGAPIILNSVYRSPAYNEAVGGVENSQHMAFCAADFTVRASSSPSDWASVLKQMRADGMFSGGIGVYNTFIHVDTRGEDVDW